MLTCTTWKSRPLTPAQTNRMMEVWGKLEAKMAENTDVERLCWFIAADGSSGVTVSKSSDPEATAAFELEVSLALSEFLELDTKTVLDLDSAVPAIMKGLEHINS